MHPLHHPSAHAATRVWVKGEGARITDATGRDYIDGLSGLWNVNIGHGRRELGDAAQQQMATLAFHSAYAGGTNEQAIRLAERLSGLTCPSINTFFFTSGGAESSESSFKTARFYWKALGQPGKIKVISRHRAYHGLTLAAMSATGLPAFWPMFEPRTPGFSHIEAPDPYRFVPTDTSVSLGVAAANKLEEAILQEGPDTVAAFIAEPVQGAGGVIVPPADYFPRIREICDRYDVLLIADEVITGFGRTGTLVRTGPLRRRARHHAVCQGHHERLRAARRHRRIRPDSRGHQRRRPGPTLDARLHLLGASDLLRGGAGQPRHHRRRGPGCAGGHERCASAGQAAPAGVAGRRRPRAGPGPDGGRRGRGRSGHQAAARAGARRESEAHGRRCWSAGSTRGR